MPRRFRGLTPKQLAVFEQIACNNDKCHNRQTLKSLVKKGLIAESQERLSGRLLIYIYRYCVPIPVHYDWCCWCSGEDN